jgi:hypothetical protein
MLTTQPSNHHSFVQHLNTPNNNFQYTYTTGDEDYYSGMQEHAYFVDYVIKFDSAASTCMSSRAERIVGPAHGNNTPTQADPVPVAGFDGSIQYSSRVGLNADGKRELYVPSMPSSLVLLCAHAYASEGAAILLRDGGVVLRLQDNQIQDLKEFISKYPKVKTLTVSNRTYNVVEGADESQSAPQQQLIPAVTQQPSAVDTAFSSSANRYFNSKVQVSNGTDRILSMLLTGLTYNDIYSHLKNGSLGGLPPDLTLQSMNSFAHRYGKMPEIVRLAKPEFQGNRIGLMDPPAPLSRPGQRVEIDVMETDYLEPFLADGQQARQKLKSFGQAIGAAVAIDCYSGFIVAKLLTSFANSEQYVRPIIDTYNLHGVHIKLIAADSGIVPHGVYQVVTPQLQAYLHSIGIQTERVEPHNHSRGGAHVERAIRSIKELISIAIIYVLKNPNFNTFGFSKEVIIKLWAELLLWAVTVTNLKICPNQPTKSKYEVFCGQRPNMQTIRLLPIFSVVMVAREASDSSIPSRKPQHQIGLYVGPSLTTPGAARFAITTNSTVSILTTSRFTSASEGGTLNIYSQVSNGLHTLLDQQQDPSNDIRAVIAFKDREYEQIKQAPPGTPNASNSNDIKLQSAAESAAQQPHQQNLPLRRSARIAEKLRQFQEEIQFAAEFDDPLPELALFADWITFEDDDMYYSYDNGTFIRIDDLAAPVELSEHETAFKAVTKNTPKSFSAALQHPLWGEAARQEFDTLLSTGAIVKVDKSTAMDAINNQHADLTILFPIYEEKIREGQLVHKVRLVANGTTHYHADNTYSSTPSREELLILLHIIAAFDWDFAHLDEKRAFLSASYQSEHPTFAKLRGDNTFYQVTGALYGLKTSPKDYQDNVAERFLSLGYHRSTICSCIYMLQTAIGLAIVFGYVDDFLFTASSRSYLDSSIVEFRTKAQTTEPIYDPTLVLGLELCRHRDRRAISVTMSGKIDELVNKQAQPATASTKKHVPPMPVAGYIMRDEDYAKLQPDRAAFLTKKEQKQYMEFVGSLVWISGIRLDITFAVMYLTWQTHHPRRHHMDMANYVVSYLSQSRELPLVLGGQLDLQILGFSDASLGTAPHGRSTTGHLVKLSDQAGAVIAKSKATSTVTTSSFEAELDSASTAVKSVARVQIILEELRQRLSSIPQLYCDNKAMVEFVQGYGVAKSVRHIELKQYYIKEQVKKGKLNISFMAGKDHPADKLTKLGDRVSHGEFVRSIMGHAILTSDNTTTQEAQQPAPWNETAQQPALRNDTPASVPATVHESTKQEHQQQVTANPAVSPLPAGSFRSLPSAPSEMKGCVGEEGDDLLTC